MDSDTDPVHAAITRFSRPHPQPLRPPVFSLPLRKKTAPPSLAHRVSVRRWLNQVDWVSECVTRHYRAMFHLAKESDLIEHWHGGLLASGDLSKSRYVFTEKRANEELLAVGCYAPDLGHSGPQVRISEHIYESVTATMPKSAYLRAQAMLSAALAIAARLSFAAHYAAPVRLLAWGERDLGFRVELVQGVTDACVACLETPHRVRAVNERGERIAQLAQMESEGARIMAVWESQGRRHA